MSRFTKQKCKGAVGGGGGGGGLDSLDRIQNQSSKIVKTFGKRQIEAASVLKVTLRQGCWHHSLP